MKAPSMGTNIDLQSLLVEQLRQAISFDIPENTALLESHEARGGPNPDFSENDIQNKGKRKLTGKGNKAFRLAVKRAEDTGVSPLSAVSETETQTSKNKALSRRAKKLEGGNPIAAVRRIAPGSPRYLETIKLIEEARGENFKDGKIRALLIKDGIDPTGFGF